MNLSKIKTIYVYCLANVVTGGCELLHQLVHVLNVKGYDAYIVYVGDNGVIPSEYAKYKINVAKQVCDEESSLIVLDEGFLYKAKEYKKAHLMFWWLSVDNFYCDDGQINFLSFFYLFRWNRRLAYKVYKKKIIRLIKYFDCPDRTFSLRDLKRISAINAYQSEYARLFLNSRGFKNVISLSDYINLDFINDLECKKEPIVLYNPRKGFEFTKKLMAFAPDLQWIPIQNYSREQLISLLKRSMVYIDFGNHPGKDRLPREAALCGCCVVTGNMGSAKNSIDIPIPAKYKFRNLDCDIKNVINQLYYILDHYEECKSDFASYVDIIKGEKEKFLLDVDAIFDREF